MMFLQLSELVLDKRPEFLRNVTDAMQVLLNIALRVILSGDDAVTDMVL